MMLELKYLLVAVFFSSITLNDAIENSTSRSDIQEYSNFTEKYKTLMDDLKLIESWKEITNNAKTGMQSLLKNALPMFIRLTSKASMTPECQGSLLSMLVGLSSMKKWPLLMLDASGKIPSGLSSGSTAELGDYDSCLNITVREKSARQDKVTGMYCPVIISPKVPKTLKLDFVNMTGPDTIFASFQDKVHILSLAKIRTGICLPSSCSKEDIESLILSVADGYPFDFEVPVCDVKKANHLTWLQLIILSCFAVLLIVLTLGTGIDLILQPSSKQGVLAILLRFSLYTNGKEFLETEVKTSKLKALRGIKVLSIFWVILVHTYVQCMRYSMRRLSNALENFKDPLFEIVINGYSSVDTFFVLSGLLVSYQTMTYMEITKGRLNFLAFYFRRWWRLTPSLLLLLGMVTLFPLMGSGPLWNELVTREVDVCNRNWWTTLLFITSWLDSADMCLVHTWFISSDFHYFLISPFLLFIFYRRPKIAIFLSCIIILGSITTSAIIVFNHNMIVHFPLSLDELTNYRSWLDTVYFKPYSHLSPYFVGFLLGNLLYKRSEIKLKPIWVILGWTLSTFTALAVLIGAYSWANGTQPTLAEMIAYRSLYSAAWALSISWIIFACHYGYGGYVNSLLSWKLFVPLNRLVYLMYLTHFPIQWIRIGSRKHAMPFDHIENIYEYFGNMCITIGVSIFAYLALEAPMASLSMPIFARIMLPKPVLEEITIKKYTITSSPIIEKSPEKEKIEELPSRVRYPPHPNIPRQINISSDDITGKFPATLMNMLVSESEPTTASTIRL